MNLLQLQIHLSASLKTLQVPTTSNKISIYRSPLSDGIEAALVIAADSSVFVLPEKEADDQKGLSSLSLDTGKGLAVAKESWCWSSISD